MELISVAFYTKPHVEAIIAIEGTMKKGPMLFFAYLTSNPANLIIFGHQSPLILP